MIKPFLSLALISVLVIVSIVSANMSTLVSLSERLAILKERNKITVEQHTVIVNEFATKELLHAKMGDDDDDSAFNELPKLKDTVADAFRVWLHEEVSDGDMTEFMANHLRGLFQLGPPPNYQTEPLSKNNGPVPANYSGNGVVQFVAKSDYTFPSAGRYNGIWGYHKGRREYALHCNFQGFHILDVTDAEQNVITRVQFIKMGGGELWRDAATEGDYVYVAAQKAKKPKETANLWIIHLVQLSGDLPQGTDSNPISKSNIKEVIGYKNLGHTVNVWNGLLFLNSAFDSNGCTVLDIATDPMNPVELGKWIDGDCHDSFAKRILHKGALRDILFSADGTYGQFRIIDITNVRTTKTNQFQQIGTTNNQFTYAHQNVVTNDGTILFAFEERDVFDIAAYDISDLTDPKLISKFQWSEENQTNSKVHNGFVRGNFLFVAYYSAGLRVFDISNVFHIVEVGKLETYRDPDGDGIVNNMYNDTFVGAWNVYVNLPSGNVLISDMNYGLFVVGVDYGDPNSNNEPPPSITCRSVGLYFYLKHKFCQKRANKSSAKYASFWEIRSGTKQEVLNRACESTPCSEVDCCKWGPARKCSNTGTKGLIEGGFTQQMCGTKRKLKPKSKLRKVACTGKNGAKCLKNNCCRKALSN